MSVYIYIKQKIKKVFSIKFNDNIYKTGDHSCIFINVPRTNKNNNISKTTQIK